MVERSWILKTKQKSLDAGIQWQKTSNHTQNLLIIWWLYRMYESFAQKKYKTLDAVTLSCMSQKRYKFFKAAYDQQNKNITRCRLCITFQNAWIFSIPISSHRINKHSAPRNTKRKNNWMQQARCAAVS